MGKGVDLARSASPEHAQAIDDFKDQLLLCLVKRLGELSPDGVVDVPVVDVDNTGGFTMSMSVEGGSFKLKVNGKH